MKQLILTIFIFTGLSVSSQQLMMYGRTNFNGKVIPDINYYGTKELPKGFGISYFLLVEPGFAEAYAGPTYSPADWIQIGVSAGIEQTKPYFRGAGSLWLGYKKTSVLFLWEKGFGKGNFWYKGTLSYQATPLVNIGLCAWRFHGFGPIFTYEIPKSDVKLWVMPAYDFENSDYHTNTRMVFGVNLNPKAIIGKIVKKKKSATK